VSRQVWGTVMRGGVTGEEIFPRCVPRGAFTEAGSELSMWMDQV